MRGIFFLFIYFKTNDTPSFTDVVKVEREREEKRLRVRTHVKTLAGIIWDSGAASIRDCHVLVELGITKPNSKNHSGDGRWPVLTRWRQAPFNQQTTTTAAWTGPAPWEGAWIWGSSAPASWSRHEQHYQIHSCMIWGEEDHYIVANLLLHTSVYRCTCTLAISARPAPLSTYLLDTVLWRKLSVPVWTSLIFQRRKSSVLWKRLCISGSSWGPELE